MRIVCPMCQKRLENVPDDFGPRPFCSPRCKLLDLGNWLGEKYRVSQPATALDEPAQRGELTQQELGELPGASDREDYH